MSTLTSYKDGSLGGGPNMSAIRDGSLGGGSNMSAFQDGSLGYVQSGSFRDGSLGSVQSGSYKDGSLGCGCGMKGLGEDAAAVKQSALIAVVGIAALLAYFTLAPKKS